MTHAPQPVPDSLDQHIELTSGVAGGRPRIGGRRITVRNVAVWQPNRLRPASVLPWIALRSARHRNFWATRNGPASTDRRATFRHQRPRPADVRIHQRKEDGHQLDDVGHHLMDAAEEGAHAVAVLGHDLEPPPGDTKPVPSRPGGPRSPVAPGGSTAQAGRARVRRQIPLADESCSHTASRPATGSAASRSRNASSTMRWRVSAWWRGVARQEDDTD